MRINLIGNVLNLAFIFGRFLQKKGHQVRVFVDRNASELYLPHWEFPEFKNKLPEWAEMVDVDLKRLFIRGTKERNFIKKLKQCDIIQAFGESVIWARWTGRPYVFLSYGGDLDILPFDARRIKSFIYAHLLRDALSKAALTLYTMPQQERSIAKLNLTNDRFFPCAVPVDIDRYKPFSQDERKKLRARYDCDFIFFQPARQEWTCHDTNNKGNDKLFRAFARFIKDGQRKAILIVVEKGRDVDKSKELVRQLGIERYVKWIGPVDKRGLVEILNTADICFDDFAYGFYGLVTLEALSAGVPTFLYFNQNIPGEEAPPVVNVLSEDQIYEKMMELTAEKDGLKQIGYNSRQWILKYHHAEKVIDRYLSLYKEILKIRQS